MIVFPKVLIYLLGYVAHFLFSLKGVGIDIDIGIESVFPIGPAPYIVFRLAEADGDLIKRC